MFQIDFRPDVNSMMRRSVYDVFLDLPPKITDVLMNSHVSVCVGRRLGDMLNGNRRPWGYVRTLNESAGVYLHGRRGIYLAQERLEEGAFHWARRPRHTCCHELGHCLDRLLGDLFLKRDFRTAFYEDVMRLKKLGVITTEPGLDYFARLEGPGRCETAAECIALLLGDNPKQNHAWRFPKCFFLLKNKLKGLLDA